MSATSMVCTSTDMHIYHALALPLPVTTNALPRDVHAALRRSDRKAGKVLGVTVTRDVTQFRAGLDLLVSDQENLHYGNRGDKGGKRSFTLVGALKELGLGLGRKKIQRTDRVVLGERNTISYLPLDDEVDFGYGNDVKTPTARDFNESEEEKGEDFVWDCVNPFATPPNTPVRAISSAIKQFCEPTCPLAGPMAEMDRPTGDTSDGQSFLNLDLDLDEIDGLVSCGADSDEDAENVRRCKRAAMRSRMKTLEILGEEARDAMLEK
ncbi:hypothetical protein BV22DRAFT_1037705 [Leucogyrophana mollusca]|uniref:Uncharacterized protein n=1 Tax=Leucogyrophana mollusca TaxID=85980 RepID=A0ACB8B932_9AGAM|nr:hypothetical protein BV22DRAFT_1037705 [Leucogyrophana mollusca]